MKTRTATQLNLFSPPPRFSLGDFVECPMGNPGIVIPPTSPEEDWNNILPIVPAWEIFVAVWSPWGWIGWGAYRPESLKRWEGPPPPLSLDDLPVWREIWRREKLKVIQGRAS